MRIRIPSIPVSEALLFCAIVAVPAAHADTVVLKNGDRLTGTAVKLEGGKLSLKTAYADVIAISFDQVTSLSLEQPLLLTQPNGVLSVTRMERTGSGLVLTAPGGPRTVAPEAVAVMRSADDEKAYEASLHPNWGHAWTGAANVSLALARGNADTSTFGAGVTAVRATPGDKTSLSLSTIYSTNANATPSTSAKETDGGARYDHNVGPRIFFFGTGDFSTNALQNLDLRSIVGGGIGYHVLKDARQTLDFAGGLVWTHEHYSPLIAGEPATINSFAALDVGEQYALKLGKNSSLTEQVFVYPDMSNTGQYQLAAGSTFSTKLAGILSWQTSFTDQYTSFPPAGKLDNDLILTTGLGIAFSRK
jgi:putative salt-induced outer membrane protein YdiY